MYLNPSLDGVITAKATIPLTIRDARCTPITTIKCTPNEDWSNWRKNEKNTALVGG